MWKKYLINYFPYEFQQELLSLSEEKSNTLEEIRVRVNRPIELIGGSWSSFLSARFSSEQCDKLLLSLCDQSLFAIENELKRGFLTVKGGFRIGLGGKVLMHDECIERLSRCTFFNFRIAKQKIGCALPVLPSITPKGKCVSTLVLSAPGDGKTTLLRDIGKSISDGIACHGQKVCFIDERSELCGCDEGIPTNDIGSRSDVIDGITKPKGIELALRCLSPEVIVADEIGTIDDEKALIEAMGAGIALIASAHGNALGQFNRPLLKRLIGHGLFERFICLKKQKDKRIYSIYDENFNLLGEHSS